MHSIQCQCKKLSGQIEGQGISNRLICYCADCQNFARFLAMEGVLDDQGGTEIVQISQPRVRISQGIENLAALRLNDKGLIRWYASCCNTPLGNTLANAKTPFIGLIHSCLDKSRMDQDFGSDIARVNVKSAMGEPRPKANGVLKMVWRFLQIVLFSKGGNQRSPLFTSEGKPVVEPMVLSSEQLQSLSGKH